MHGFYYHTSSLYHKYIKASYMATERSEKVLRRSTEALRRMGFRVPG
jgi:hypothetical protein